MSVVPAGEEFEVAMSGWVPPCEGSGEAEALIECGGCGDRLCDDCWGAGERFCDDCMGEDVGARPVETVDVGEKYL
ncbi:MAG: hypothetical protein ACLGI2_14525 [Acidimicrobiia bacterium]